MNDGLLDCFRHNAWATRQVLDACRGLTDEQLRAAVTGTYGSIIDTLRHTVRSEAGYCRRLTGEAANWLGPDADAPDIDEMIARNDDLAARWERFLAAPFDAERIFVIPWHDSDRNVPAGVVLTQALHHGNEHRTQVCTTLTSIGVESPALGVWEFAEATDRAPRVTARAEG
ncbi:MAG TPA: DinB family protein [Thermomicrobiales bacterium]|nr:DinB family protein [Thermomicrobiales bacterium]